MVSSKPILMMRDIYVGLDKFAALKGVDFDLVAGEVHALVGEHRAGKSTLVKLLSGAATKNRGTIRLYGKSINKFTPRLAMSNKIAIVYQEINIIPTMDAIENIFVGQPLSFKESQFSYKLAKAKSVLSRLGVDIDLTIPLEQLSKDEQIMVEFARALSIDPDILILDEISSKVTPTALERIHLIIEELKRQGSSIIYISHNLDEIFEFADRVTILKDGRHQGTEAVKDLDKIKLINMTYSFVLNREELKQENKELYFFKKYNEEIIKNLTVGVIILDEFANLYLMNNQAEQVLDLKSVHAKHNNIEDFIHPDRFVEASEILSSVKKGESKTWNEIAYQGDKLLKINTLPFTDEMYQFLGTILLVEDVSEQRQFEDYLIRTEKISSVAELAAGVAHEINNPLAIISNYVKLLQGSVEKKKNQAMLEKVESELDRIVDVIDNLLSFTRIQSVADQKVHVYRMVSDVITLLSHKFSEKKLIAEFSWDEHQSDRILVQGQENLLKQVIMNLLVNAYDAVDEAGHMGVRIENNEEREFVDIIVFDNGPGISPEVRDKIFTPFFTTKQGKKNSGLGLSICQHIVDSHHGLIMLNQDSETQFVVRLPVLETKKIAHH